MSTNQMTELENSEDYEKLLASGTRNLICKEIQLAVNQLQEACALISKKFGETADECADAYFQYGLSLLELSRMESGVLGNALQGITEEEGSNCGEESFVEQDGTTEEEKEKISEEILDAMLEPSTTSLESKTTESITDGPLTTETMCDKSKIEDTTTDGAVTSETICNAVETGELNTESTNTEALTTTLTDVNQSTKTQVQEIGSDGESEEDEDSGEDVEDDTENEAVAGPSKEKTDEEEDVSNIQLAWEMLELARSIYKKREEAITEDENKLKDTLLKQADCFMRLGEVSLETAQYLQSVEDFNSCREILEKVVESNHRRLAEIYYQIGQGLTYATLFEEAIIAYNKALNIIGAKIEGLEKCLNGLDSDTENSIKKEIMELKELIPDIKTKIEDVEEEQKSAPGLKETIIENITSESEHMKIDEGIASIPIIDEAHPVKDISHLVRKKRKPDEESNESDESNKKQKTYLNEDLKDITSKVDQQDISNKTHAECMRMDQENSTNIESNENRVNEVVIINGHGMNGVSTECGVTTTGNGMIDEDNVKENISNGATINGKSCDISPSKTAQIYIGNKEAGDIEMVESLPEKSLPVAVDEAGDSILTAA